MVISFVIVSIFALTIEFTNANVIHDLPQVEYPDVQIEGGSGSLIFNAQVEGGLIGKEQIDKIHVISEDILKANPRLTFIGTINGKSYYSDFVTRSWDNSLTYCTSIGMNFAHFASSSEISFINNKLTPTHYWTGGYHNSAISDYRWISTGAYTGALPFGIYYNMGLASLGQSSTLWERPKHDAWCSICIVGV